MTPETIFAICNYGVLPAWLLLALAPSWSVTHRIVHQIWIPCLLGAVYLTLFTTGPAMPEGGSMGTLGGVMTLFSTPHIMLVGWVHYLVFDLFVGAWEVRDARRRSISHLYVVPCLFLTLMVGPVGLLAYLVMRWVLRRELGLEETA
jgi:asparagine N-glycosylation enzyme membrane subunit Stt3